MKNEEKISHGLNGLKRAVFLDRDGVLNEPVVREGKPYPPGGVSELRVCPGAVEAARKWGDRFGPELHGGGSVAGCGGRDYSRMPNRIHRTRVPREPERMDFTANGLKEAAEWILQKK